MDKYFVFLIKPCILVLLITVGVFAQTEKVNEKTYVLSVSGEGINSQNLSLTEIMKMPSIKVRATPHNGKEAEYEGVILENILKNAGQKFGENLKGKLLTLYLLVEAADGYQAVFSIPELDPAFTNKVIILAYKQDDKLLGESAGPLQIIVPDEKRHARWIRQVKSFMIKRSQ